MFQPNNKGSDSEKTISIFTAFALSFGCAVGWGSFVMPGNTFLPIAGPLGSVIGLSAGAGLMLIIGINFSRLMKRFPGRGGSYTYTRVLLGGDHAFLCAWMLVLTYTAVIWANASALALIMRYLAGDVLKFGFSYDVAGYTVYLGEVLLTFLLVTVCLICTAIKRLARAIMAVCAVVLFAGITVCFIGVVAAKGGITEIEPLFNVSGNYPIHIIGIVVLAPWAYLGFDSIAHVSSEIKFSQKKSLPIMIAALTAAALAYSMLVICASMVHPDGFADWNEYIQSIGSWNSIKNLPTFYSVSRTIGTPGVAALFAAAFSGIVTAVIGYTVLIIRLVRSISENNPALKGFSRTDKRGAPWLVLTIISASTLVVSLVGRTAISWIVDITTFGAVVSYGYTSLCAFILGRREKDRSGKIFGILGILISAAFLTAYLWPDVRTQGNIATESFLILIIWSVMGMFAFRLVMQKDKSKTFGKSGVVWIILFLVIVLVSHSWIYRTTLEKETEVSSRITTAYEEKTEREGVESDPEEKKLISEQVHSFGLMERMNVLIQDGLILCSIAVIFSIFAMINKREKQTDKERLRAEENSRAKSIFLSNMSHDIRTPMNAVTGYTALALQAENLPDNVRDYLGKIDYSSKQLLSLINDILDMSRIESGKVELDNAPADLCRIIKESIGIFAIQMAKKDLECVADYESITDRCVICDENRIHRILLNLMSNSLKFTPKGGIITLALHQLGVENGEGIYELSVADTGIGMSPEFAKHVFDAFERERTQTVSKLQGTGLGMAITKSLVDLMGGEIRVESEQNKGTKYTIWLRFPICDPSEIESREAAVIEDNVSFHGVRLLVTDDNPVNSEIASEILRQEGFTVEVAENGKIAVEMVEKAEPNYYSVILMDIQMPVMNGYDASLAIRALDGERAELPIIAITANSFESDRKAAFEAGMNDHVAKPFNPEELVNVIAKHIKKQKT